ncbi:hypothetical protein CDAR_6541 [Caerostris darwini]|uniref:Uncharacterized protein n=1 Tax=Caerostris darwini TaxID=1538125 RepID=A0AAV4MQL4_9ARAC|nr:hypothetical protein CDAR_6541 [Caerostris darwini]
MSLVAFIAEPSDSFYVSDALWKENVDFPGLCKNWIVGGCGVTADMVLWYGKGSEKTAAPYKTEERDIMLSSGCHHAIALSSVDVV